MPSVTVDCTNLEGNPHCPHGPTLKFTRSTNRKKVTFFACAACRDRKLCPFYLEDNRETTKGQRLVLNYWETKTLSSVDIEKLHQKFRHICKLDADERTYCHTCESLLVPTEVESHSGHLLKRTITNYELTHPTKIILPLTDDKKEAQYWFTSNTVEVLIKGLKISGIGSVICLGTPSLNEVLRERCYKTLLLDLDKRYLNFYNEAEFCWFNMFNFYFMTNPVKYLRSVKEAMKFESVALIIDPPFGALLEPLAKTVDALNKLYKEEKNNASAKLKVFLALPYFMEQNITASFADLKPLQYVVDYINQSKFKDRIKRSTRSPVRFFTNVDLGLIPLPKSEGYVLCKKCRRWVGDNSKHCDICNTCPPVHRETFQHCLLCAKCVKRSWKHCHKCNKCVNANHVLDSQTNSCLEYVQKHGHVSLM